MNKAALSAAFLIFCLHFENTFSIHIFRFRENDHTNVSLLKIFRINFLKKTLNMIYNFNTQKEV